MDPRDQTTTSSRRHTALSPTGLRAQRSARRQSWRDAGQTALVLVVGITVLLTIIGGVMVSTINNNSPILAQASIERLAYRALASGLNSYQSAINSDPFLAACNSTTNVGGANANAACAGISYQTWSVVPGTDVGNGVIPEYYKFDNPFAVVNSTTNALTYLDVEIVGAAGFNNNIVYYSTVAKFTPANGFLNNVWWSNFESYNSASNNGPTLTPTGCSYYYSTGYNNSGSCTPVYFGPNDSITGPVFTNDSIFVDQQPNFGSSYGVTTADPSCLFVDPNDGNHGSPPGCANAASQDVGTYNSALSSNSSKNLEPIPTDNAQLGNYAKQGGCYYEGPTTVTLSSSGQMTVVSPDTPATGGNDNLNFASDTSTCPVNGSASLPVNGVLFVDSAPSGNAVNCANPFDGVVQGSGNNKTCTTDSQTLPGGCQGCYYGQTNNPDQEADAFVSGNLSGHLTIASHQNIIIDGPLKYADCTWAGTAHWSNCNYNSFTSSTAVNDTLGLIAYQYVEVDMPVDSNGNVLKTCGTSGAQAAPLCDPSTSTGGGNNGQGLTIDASILALTASFLVNNYATSNFNTGGAEGTLTLYGSLQQDARGAVGTFNGQGIQSGYSKHYLWDPRLPFYSPPFYLTPGTPSWSLVSSSESYTGACPTQPPAQSGTTTSQPTFNQTGGGWTTCSTP